MSSASIPRRTGIAKVRPGFQWNRSLTHSERLTSREPERSLSANGSRSVCRARDRTERGCACKASRSSFAMEREWELIRDDTTRSDWLRLRVHSRPRQTYYPGVVRLNAKPGVRDRMKWTYCRIKYADTPDVENSSGTFNFRVFRVFRGLCFLRVLLVSSASQTCS